MIVDEELFQLFAELFPKIINVVNFIPRMSSNLYRKEPIIPRNLFALFLLALNNSNQPTPENTAGERRLIHQHENIDGIAVVSFSGRYKSKIIRECHSSGEDLL